MICQDLRGQLAAASVTSINQSYDSLQIPLVRHSGAFTDWLKFVTAVTYHFVHLLFHTSFGIYSSCKEVVLAVESSRGLTILTLNPKLARFIFSAKENVWKF